MIGSLLVVAAAVFWLLPDGPVEPRLPLSVFGPLLLIAGWLSWKYYEPAEKRSVRLAISIYLFFGIAITAGGLVQRFAPDPDAGVAIAGQKPTNEKTAAEPAAVPAAAVPAIAATNADRRRRRHLSTRTAAAKAAPEADKKVEGRETQENQRRKSAPLNAGPSGRRSSPKGKRKRKRKHASSRSGSYWETVKWSGGEFPEKAASDFGFATILIGMFLLGTWFVRSGVMENAGAHLPFFRKLAVYGLPIGIGIGLLGSLINMSHTPGDRYDGRGIAFGLSTIGNLPACLGYVGMVVLMLHSKTVFSSIRVLGPLGRMALTNYLTQSLICAIYFYGYAMGHWGMPRAQQVLFVLVVYAAQIAFSHWWLSRFRYGPMEWLWRGFTYGQVPQFRRS